MRIAIVNDVKLAVEALRRVVTGVRDHEIAWIAYDGAEAVAKCARDKPDLILMDLIMPVTDGVEATRRIMQETPLRHSCRDRDRRGQCGEGVPGNGLRGARCGQNARPRPEQPSGWWPGVARQDRHHQPLALPTRGLRRGSQGAIRGRRFAAQSGSLRRIDGRTESAG